VARGRFISTSVAEDDRLSRLSMAAELLYLKTIPHLDRDGMISGKPGYLWGRVCPLREELMPEMQKAIDEWIAVGLVILMATDTGPVLFFPGFLKNNNLLHYDRESPSRFPVPPGYERTEMGLIPEGAEQKKKPTRKPKEAQVPPSSNGNGEVVNDSVIDEVMDLSSKGEVKVEVKDQGEGEAPAREPEAVAPPPTNPPPSYRSQPLPGEYIPGVRRPQHNQAKRNCDHFTAQAAKHGVGAEPFRLMVDAVLDATGKRALADTDTEPGQRTLNQAKETALTLAGMGRRTLEDVQDVLRSWREDDYRGASAPTFGQIVEHASAMAAGTHVTTRRQEGSKKEFSSLADYNEWAARNDPQYKRIREGIIVRGTFTKREQYQPVMAH
jgi:hypothetical protein